DRASPELLVGPMRVTEIEFAYFKDQSSLANFAASYDAFPDTATGLIESKTGWPVEGECERPSGLLLQRLEAKSRRVDLDFFCGLGIGLVELLERGGFDDALRRFLQEPG